MNSFNISDLDGGSKSWVPENIGDKVQGKVVDIKRVQQTSFDDGTPLEWPDGSPRMQTVVEIQTSETTSGDDDGVRTLWLKGGKNYEVAEGEGKSGELALAQAAKDAGASTIETHGELTFVFSGKSKPTTRGYQPAKLYTARYKAPVASVSTSDLFDD